VSLAVALFTAALVIPAALRGREFSLYDEPSHADYAYRVAHFHIPARGSLLSPFVLSEWSCRRSPLAALPPCGQRAPPSDYPLRGENYNHGHPPLYYLVVGFGARAGDVVVPGNNFFALARILGLGWLLAGMGVLYKALRDFGADARFGFAGAALLPLVPGVLHASSAVTNDATAVLCGSAALLVAARILVKDCLGWVVPAAVTGLATATKVLSAMPMLGVACVVLVMAYRRWESDRALAIRLAKLAAAIALAFVVVFKGWTTFQSLRGADNWVSPIAGFPDRRVTGSPIDELLSTSLSGFQLVSSYYLPPQINGTSIRIWARLLAMLIAAAPLLAMLTFRPRSPKWIVGAVALGGLIAFPAVVEAEIYVQNDQFLPTVPGRYGMSFIPWTVACLALVASEQRLLRTTATVLVSGALIVGLSVSGVFALRYG
jgi:hypothetical protein